MSDDDDLAVRRQQWWLQALSDAGDAWSCRVHAFVDELPTTRHYWRTSRAITRRRITTFVGCAPTTMTSCSICHSEGYKLLKGISAGEQIFMNVQLPLKHATSCILNCFRRVAVSFDVSKEIDHGATCRRNRRQRGRYFNEVSCPSWPKRNPPWQVRLPMSTGVYKKLWFCYEQ